jgi:hypothetical protein
MRLRLPEPPLNPPDSYWDEEPVIVDKSRGLTEYDLDLILEAQDDDGLFEATQEVRS